jgi:hypothetical protein
MATAARVAGDDAELDAGERAALKRAWAFGFYLRCCGESRTAAA